MQSPSLVFSVSLAVFDLRLGNSISYTFPQRQQNQQQPHQSPSATTTNDDEEERNAPDRAAEPIDPSNVMGGSKLHDYCFPDGGHDAAFDCVTFAVRLNTPIKIDPNDGRAAVVAVAANENNSNTTTMNNSSFSDMKQLLEQQNATSLHDAIVGPEDSSPLIKTPSGAAAAASLPAAATATSSNSTVSFLDEPQSTLFGTALYVRAADSCVERGALQRAILVLTRVPLHKPVSEYLKHRTLDKLSDASYKNTGDSRLHELVDCVYQELTEMFEPALSSFRNMVPLFAEFEGNRIFIPRVGKPSAPAAPLVLLGFRSSVVSLLRMLGPTHSALLLYAIISRIPVIVIGRTASEVCESVCAAIHLCRPLPIDIGHFAPYAPISVLDRLIADASTTPFAVVGATNAFVAHKQFKGICKLILPSLAEEVAAMSAGGGSSGSSPNSIHGGSSSRGPNAAFVEYPANSLLHKKGPSAFLPRTFLSRVKGLVALAQEADASEIHIRSLVLALNFALSLEIRSAYGDVGAAFAAPGTLNVVSSPLTDSSAPSSPGSSPIDKKATDEQEKKRAAEEKQEKIRAKREAVEKKLAEKQQQQAQQQQTNNSSTSPRSDTAVATAGAVGSPLSSGQFRENSSFDMVGESSPNSNHNGFGGGAGGGSPNNNNNNNNGNGDSPRPADVSHINSFPALKKTRADESKLINALELALRSFLQERSNERKSVLTVRRWFAAVRGMLLEVAQASSEQQRILFEDLMPNMDSIDNAVSVDIANLHSEKEDVGNVLVGEDMLLSLGEQQRLCRVDLGRFVEHYRRRAGVAVDMLCNKNNIGARARAANELFCDVFSLTGLECYEIQREVLLAQAQANVTVAPCEGAEDSDRRAPPKPFWSGVDVTLSLSNRFLCMDAATQTIASKALSGITKLLPKGDSYYEQKKVGEFSAQQVVPIAGVARIEVLESADSGGVAAGLLKPLTSTVIPSDLHTLRLQLNVPKKQTGKPGDEYPWRAKLDIRLSQKSGVSQLLFLLVNKHQDFTQAVRKMTQPSVGADMALVSPGSSSTDLNNSNNHNNNAAALIEQRRQRDQQLATAIDSHFLGPVPGQICPIALGPSRLLRDVPAITTDEVYENERNYPIVGWTKKLLPHDPPAWSDRCGIHQKTKEGTALPPGYEWASEWCLLPYYDGRLPPEKFEQELAEFISAGGEWKSGEEGWVYGTFWRLADFHAAPFSICSIRRRRWVRQRRLIQAVRDGQSVAQQQAAEQHQQQQQQQLSPASAVVGGGDLASDLNNSLAFASHLNSLEQLHGGGGSGGGGGGGVHRSSPSPRGGRAEDDDDDD